MKSFVLICFLVAGALVFISCSGDKNDAAVETAEQAAHAGHAHTAATEDDGLVLNDGAKWQMDDHTRASFIQMADSFGKVDAAALDIAELKVAGDGLKKDLEGLIQGCTMTGADHDQLHVYLMKYIPAVTSLQESGSAADAKVVQHYLSIYGNYFE